MITLADITRPLECERKRTNFHLCELEAAESVISIPTLAKTKKKTRYAHACTTTSEEGHPMRPLRH